MNTKSSGAASSVVSMPIIHLNVIKQIVIRQQLQSDRTSRPGFKGHCSLISPRQLSITMTANSTRPPITILRTHFRAKIISPSPEGRSASPFDSGLTGEDVEIKYTSAAASPKPNVVDKRR